MAVVSTRTCMADGCSRPRRTKGYCATHYKTYIWRPANREKDRAGSKAWKDRNREVNRERDRAYGRRLDLRGRCEICGGPMGVNYFADGECQTCRKRGHEERWRELQTLWNEGRTFPEITAELGWTESLLGKELHTARAAGWSLPYRYRRKVAA
jgi:hypothetical protein